MVENAREADVKKGEGGIVLRNLREYLGKKKVVLDRRAMRVGRWSLRKGEKGARRKGQGGGG